MLKSVAVYPFDGVPAQIERQQISGALEHALLQALYSVVREGPAATGRNINEYDFHAFHGYW